jgi:hypothetical protein
MGQRSDPETLVIHQKLTPGNNPKNFKQHVQIFVYKVSACEICSSGSVENIRTVFTVMGSYHLEIYTPYYKNSVCYKRDFELNANN